MTLSWWALPLRPPGATVAEARTIRRVWNMLNPSRSVVVEALVNSVKNVVGAYRQFCVKKSHSAGATHEKTHQSQSSDALCVKTIPVVLYCQE